MSTYSILLLPIILLVHFGTHYAAGQQPAVAPNNQQESEGEVDDEEGGGGSAAVEWTPGYQVEADQKQYADNGMPKFFYGKDGTCGVLNEDNKYEKPTMEFMPKKMPEENVKPEDQTDCLKDFHNAHFGPVCGDPDFPYVKYCAMVKFFDNQLPEESSIFQGEKQEDMLVFVDGCAVCDNMEKAGNELSMDLKLTYTLPKGSFFTGCKEAKEIVAGQIDGIKFRTVNNKRMFKGTVFGENYRHDGNGATFVVPAEFFQRTCQGIFSTDDMPTSYTDIKLHVKHNCGSEGEFTVDLPELVTKEFGNHIVEMRALMLDLDQGMARLYERLDEKHAYVEEMRWDNWESSAK